MADDAMSTDDLINFLQTVAAESMKHTRQKKHWQAGDQCQAKINGQWCNATVLATAFSPEGDYDQVKLEIEVINKFSGAVLRAVYPKLVQSYKLRKRQVKR